MMNRGKDRNMSPSKKSFKDTRRLNNIDAFKDKNCEDSQKALFSCT